MKLFFLTETKSGCYKWRTAIPMKYLAARGHHIQLLGDDASQHSAPDVMVLFRAQFEHAIPISAWCKKNNIRLVFDTDDALDKGQYPTKPEVTEPGYVLIALTSAPDSARL